MGDAAFQFSSKIAEHRVFLAKEVLLDEILAGFPMSGMA